MLAVAEEGSTRTSCACLVGGPFIPDTSMQCIQCGTRVLFSCASYLEMRYVTLKLNPTAYIPCATSALSRSLVICRVTASTYNDEGFANPACVVVGQAQGS